MHNVACFSKKPVIDIHRTIPWGDSECSGGKMNLKKPNLDVRMLTQIMLVGALISVPLFAQWQSQHHSPASAQAKDVCEKGMTLNAPWPTLSGKITYRLGNNFTTADFRGVLLDARHVLVPAHILLEQATEIKFKFGERSQSKASKYIAVNYGLDLAVVKLDSNIPGFVVGNTPIATSEADKKDVLWYLPDCQNTQHAKEGRLKRQGSFHFGEHTVVMEGDFGQGFSFSGTPLYKKEGDQWVLAGLQTGISMDRSGNQRESVSFVDAVAIQAFIDQVALLGKPKKINQLPYEPQYYLAKARSKIQSLGQKRQSISSVIEDFNEVLKTGFFAAEEKDADAFFESEVQISGLISFLRQQGLLLFANKQPWDAIAVLEDAKAWINVYIYRLKEQSPLTAKQAQVLLEAETVKADIEPFIKDIEAFISRMENK